MHGSARGTARAAGAAGRWTDRSALSNRRYDPSSDVDNPLLMATPLPDFRSSRPEMVAPLRRTVSWLFAALAGLAAFVALFRAGAPAGGESLDGSWSTVLSWSFGSGLQFGEDIVFTYGPLGFLIPVTNYYPQTFSLFFACQIFFGLVWALLVAGHARRLAWPAQIVLILLLLAWLPVMMIDVAWYAMFALAAIGVGENAPRRLSVAAVAAGSGVMLALTLIALTKFTFLLLWAAFVAYLVAQLLLARRFALAVLSGAGSCALLLVLWSASGQAVGSLLPFVRRCLELSGGYSASMGYTPNILVDVAGVCALALGGVGVARLVVARRGDRALRLLGLFLLLTIALTWKAGYIRADGHVCIFLATTSLLTFFAHRLGTHRRRVAWMSASCVGIIAIGGLILTYRLLGGVAPALINNWSYVAFSLNGLASPERLRQAFDQGWQAGMAHYDLPSVRRIVGDARVDLLMHEQGVLLLNRFNYSPRPAFQGYGAYTASLARLNETRLLGPEAPEFLLFKFQAIDAHLPGSEDPLSQLAALRAYAPVAYEKGYVLLQRRRPAQPILPPAPAQWREVRLGERIEMPQESPQLLFFRVELNPLGRVYSALLREPALGLEITDGGGGIGSYRVARTLGDAGMLVSPQLADVKGYLRWYLRRGSEIPRNLRFVARDSAMAPLFADRIVYALVPIDLPTAMGEQPASLYGGLYPGFSHVPRNAHSPIPLDVIDNLGESVLFMHAPSSLDFVLPAGRWRAEGKFGLRADSYAPGVCPDSDGTLLRIYRGELGNLPETGALYSRQIDPLRVPTDRGNLPFSTPEFDADGNTPLTFEFSGGQGSNANTGCDWTVIGPLRFVHITPQARP